MASISEATAAARIAVAAFAAGGEYGQGPVNIPGFDPVKASFNSNLEQLASKDTAAVLADLQKNTEATLKGQ